MLGTRPDLGYTVSTLSKYNANPTPEHSIAAKRVLRYLRRTANVGITFGGQKNPAIDEALENTNLWTDLVRFTDSDWAGDLDTRKSTSGFVFLLHSRAVS